MSESGTLLPRANPAACPQLAKAHLASSSRRVREGRRIAALDGEVDAPRRQAVALGAEPTADVPPWVLLGRKSCDEQAIEALQRTIVVAPGVPRERGCRAWVVLGVKAVGRTRPSSPPR
jgi:hypothetical protein